MPTVKPLMKPRTLIAATFAALLAVLIFWAPILGLAGCAIFGAESPEECSDAALAEIEAHFAAELLASCAGHASVAECPDAERVVAKYDTIREEWVQCR